MATEVRMPQLGLTMTEGTVVGWKKNIGDTVKVEDVLVDIETDKITTEVASEVEGVLLAIRAQEGDEVPVQGLLCIIGKAGEVVEEASVAAPEPVAAPVASSVNPIAAPANGQSGAVITMSGGRVRISPLAKKIAAANNVDCGDIPGTGPGGRIVRKDILLAMKNPPAAALQPSAPAPAPSLPQEGRRERMSSMRKVVAERMLKSHSEIPVVTQTVKIDVTELLEFRQRINNNREQRFSVNDLVLKAVAKSLAANKHILVSIDGSDIVYHDRVNIGMAVALDEGLIVPVIKDADKMSLEAISAAARDLAGRARTQSLSMDEYQGATFSVSNLGMFGVESFTPIINQPNAAILGICSIEDELALIEGQPVMRKKMRISMTYDHRLMDGAVAAKFQSAVKDFLEQPLEIIL